MSKPKATILRDDIGKMICVMVEGEDTYEGSYDSFPGYQNVADVLRMMGYNVTEEGYEYALSSGVGIPARLYELNKILGED